MAALDIPWLTHMSTPRSQRSDSLDPSSSSLHPPSSPSRQPSYHESSVLSNLSAAPNPTHAAFSPTTLSSTTPSTTSAAKRRSTILVHQKSPLLLATPPQITRALAYSHPFILLLNKLAGLLTWTTGDPWESFLVLVVFWATVLYGDVAIRLAGPVVLVLMLIGGMYGRRFSPLSSSGRSEPGLGGGDGSSLGAGEGKAAKNGKRLTKHRNLSVDGIPDKPAKAGSAGAGPGGVGGVGGSKSAGGGSGGGGHQRSHSNATHVAEATSTRHQKTLDEIVETLKEFTTRCNILLEPLLELTDFLSTQRTPTSATTRPALTALLVRILLCTPVWFALTLPPMRVVTTRRVVLVVGTVALAWHARVVRVGRTILWRSASVRKVLGAVTGLQAELPPTKKSAAATPASLSATTSSSSSTTAATADGATRANGGPRESELTRALRRARGGGRDAGVRFTFIIYENQRRWVGLGWTNSLFTYERSAWTDERNNSVPPRRQFELPEVDDGNNGMGWRWVEGSRWRVDGVPDEAVAGTDGEGDKEGEWDYDGPGGRMGWVYYDNKWQNGRRGQDGWGRWTRRRKWYRDAELVEVGAEDDGSHVGEHPASGSDHDAAATAQSHDSEDATPTPAMSQRPASPAPSSTASASTSVRPTTYSESATQPLLARESDARERGREDGPHDEGNDAVSILSSSSRSGSSRRRQGSLRAGAGSRRGRRASEPVEEEEEAASLTRHLGLGEGERGGGWGVGDEVRMGLE